MQKGYVGKVPLYVISSFSLSHHLNHVVETVANANLLGYIWNLYYYLFCQQSLRPRGSAHLSHEQIIRHTHSHKKRLPSREAFFGKFTMYRKKVVGDKNDFE